MAEKNKICQDYDCRDVNNESILNKLLSIVNQIKFVTIFFADGIFLLNSVHVKCVHPYISKTITKHKKIINKNKAEMRPIRSQPRLDDFCSLMSNCSHCVPSTFFIAI